MKFYLDNGYLNCSEIYYNTKTFLFIVGARGVGKTYGFLKFLYESGLKFIYLRRTQSVLDEISTDATNPFKIINSDNDYNVQIGKIGKKIKSFFDNDRTVGYLSALSTFMNMRGIDFSDVDCIFYDEAIPEKHERAIKYEAEALWNVYETVNRNRELNGKPPVKLILAGNSNNIYNPYFVNLGIVERCARMNKKGEMMFEKNNLTVINIANSPISKLKSKTELYNLTNDTQFSNMALDNAFEIENSIVRPCKIVEYTPIVTYGELTIYSHKSRYEFYVTYTKSGNVPCYVESEHNKKIVLRKYANIFIQYYENKVFFETQDCLALFSSYFTNDY